MLTMMIKQIIFHSVFEANTGLEILRYLDEGNPQWQFRDHQFGRLTYYVTSEQLKLLKDNNVGFWVTNI